MKQSKKQRTQRSLLERHTHDIDLPLSIPAFIELALTSIKLHIGHLERDGNIGLSSKQNILEVIIGSLNLLLIRRHKPILRLRVGLDLRVLYLEQDAFAVGLVVLLFLEPVDRFADFYCSELLLLFLVCLRRDDSVAGLSCHTTSEVGLVLLALRVGHVAALVGM